MANMDIKKIIESKSNENLVKIKKSTILETAIAQGSFEKEDDSGVSLSSMTEFKKDGAILQSDRTLTLSGDKFIPNVLPIDLSFSNILDGQNGFIIKDGDCEIRINPKLTAEVEGTIFSGTPGRSDYILNDTSKLSAEAKENGIALTWELTSYSNLSLLELRRTYNFSCLNCLASYNPGMSTILFKNSLGHEIYRIKRPYIIDGDGNTYRNCGLGMESTEAAEGSFYAYINYKWLTSAAPKLPITLVMPIEKVQKYAIYLDGTRNGYSTDPIDSAFHLGRRGGKSYSLTVKVDSESIIKALSERDIKKFHVVLNLYYKKGLRMPDTPGFIATCKGEKIFADGFNSEDGNVAIDITKQVAHQYRSWLNGGYTPTNIDIYISYSSNIIGKSFLEPVMADSDYIEVFNIDNPDVSKRPCVSLAKDDDGSVAKGTPKKSISVGEAGITNINLFTQQMTHDIQLGTFDDGNISLPITLHYNSRLLDKKKAPKSFGNGWMLSIERMLIKDSSADKTLGEKRSAYLDENGDKHYLDEKWYYEEGKTKYLVDKKDVYLDNDQKLKYDILNDKGEIVETKEIKYEVDDSNGLMLISAASSENYFNKSDLKVNLNKSSIEYKIGFRKFIVNNITDGLLNVKAFFRYRDKKDLSGLEWAKEYIDTFEYNNTIIEFINPENVRFNYKDEPVTEYNETLQTMNVDITFTITDGGVILLYPKYRIYPEKQGFALGDEYIERGSYEYPATLKKVYSITTDQIVNYRNTENLQKIESQIKSVENSIKQLSETLTSCRTNLSSIIAQTGHIEMSKKLSDILSASTSYADENYKYSLSSSYQQKDTLVLQIKTYNNQLLELLTQKENLLEKKEALVTESKANETDYVADENGNYLVFNYEGQMIGATDSKENTIKISYEKDKITSVKGKSGESLLIHYTDEGNPDYMQLQDGRRIEFVYVNNALIAIKWLAENGRNASAKFTYNQHGALVSILSPEFKEEKIAYLSNKVVEVDSYIIANRIDQTIGLLPTPRKDESYKISKQNGSIILQDLIFNTEEEYFLDIEGRLVTTVAKNGRKTDYRLLNSNNNGQVYSLSCCYHDEEGKPRDKIAEFSFGDVIANTVEKTMSVQAEGTALGRIYRSKLKRGSFIAFMQKMSSSAILSPTLFKCIVIVSQFEGANQLCTSTFTFEEVKNGFIVAPFRLDDKATKVKFEMKCGDSSIDFSQLELSRIYNVEGSVNTFDDDGRIIKTEGNEGFIEYSSFFKKKPTISIQTDNYGRKKTSELRIDGSGKTILAKDGDGNCVGYTYDDEGRISENREYKLQDPTACSVTKYSYSDKGVVSEVNGDFRDEKGEYPPFKTEYDAYTGLILKEIKPNGQTVIHGYDPASFDETAISSDDEGRANLIFKEYNRGLLTKLSHEGAAFHYGYDGNGRRTYVALGDINNKLLRYTYLDARNDSSLAKTYQRIEKVANKSGYSSESTYDKYDRLIKQTYGVYTFNYTYDSRGNILTETDSSNEVNYEYEYNTNNQLINSCSKDGDYIVNKNYQYDSCDRNSKVSVSFDNDLVFSLELNYDEKDKARDLKAIYGNTTLTLKYSYNPDDSISDKELFCEQNTIKTSYEYLRQDEHATGLVSNYQVYVNKESYINQKLLYDVSGNITNIKEKVYSDDYKYDKLGRLISENNGRLGKLFKYSYDSAGNIVESIETTSSEESTIKTYSYGKDLWRDQLSSVRIKRGNDIETLLFEYDSMGRPTKYANKSMEWNTNGTLKTFENTLYTYNSKGIRIGKTIGDLEEKYILDETKILRIVKANGNIDFIYSGEKIEGFNYKEKTYLFIRDALNNVSAIIDSSTSKIAASYTYDAWGRHEIKDGNGLIVINFNGSLNGEYEGGINEFIGYINPIRYRGYFYDNETGLYYLNARYYDPSLGRFISPDILSILDDTMSEINGLNLYMYCKDNPIMFVDESGRIPHWLANTLKILGGVAIIAGCIALSIVTAGTAAGIFAGAAAGAISGGIGAGISTAVSGGNIDDFANAFLMGTATGAISGALEASPLGLGAQMGLNALISMGNYVGTQLLSGNGITFGGLLISGVIGFAMAYFGRTGASEKTYFTLAKPVPKLSRNLMRKVFTFQLIFEAIGGGIYDRCSKFYNPNRNFWGF